MAARLATPDGITAYRRRSHIAETPHGRIKHTMGFRQLTLRGLRKASGEWTFTCAVHNLMHRHHQRPPHHLGPGRPPPLTPRSTRPPHATATHRPSDAHGT